MKSVFENSWQHNSMRANGRGPCDSFLDPFFVAQKLSGRHDSHTVVELVDKRNARRDIDRTDVVLGHACSRRNKNRIKNGRVNNGRLAAAYVTVSGDFTEGPGGLCTPPGFCVFCVFYQNYLKRYKLK